MNKEQLDQLQSFIDYIKYWSKELKKCRKSGNKYDQEECQQEVDHAEVVMLDYMKKVLVDEGIIEEPPVQIEDCYDGFPF